MPRDRGAGARGPARAAAEAPARPGLRTRCRPSAHESCTNRSAQGAVALHRSDPRRRWSTSRARRRRRSGRAAQGRACAAGIAAAARRSRSAPSPRDMPRRCVALGGIDGAELARGVRRDRRAAGAICRSSRATMPTCSTPRSPTAGAPAGRPSVRVRIYGPLEARLQSVDRLVLGGLVEGVWPPETRSDPWLSRPMRHELGLDLPERRIGLSAHDFAQALGAPEVILTRAAKLGGAPTVASRFVQRLAAVAGEARWNAALARGERYLGAGARKLDDAAKAKPGDAARAEAAARRAADAAQRHRDRALAARSLHDLRQARPEAAAARRRRHAARRARPRHRDPRRDRRVHQDVTPTGLPDDPLAALLALGERHFAPLAGFSRGARVLVAALPAHRALVRRLGERGGAPTLTALRCRDRRQHRHPARQRARSS